MGVDGSGITQILSGARGPSWQRIRKAPLRVKKGKVKLNKRGRGSAGRIVCGSSPCSLKVLSAKLKAGKRHCAVKATVGKSLGAGKSTKLGVKVTGKCLLALEKAGKGLLTVKVRVTDVLGRHTLTLKSTLVPKGKPKKAK